MTTGDLVFITRINSQSQLKSAHVNNIATTAVAIRGFFPAFTREYLSTEYEKLGRIVLTVVKYFYPGMLILNSKMFIRTPTKKNLQVVFSIL